MWSCGVFITSLTILISWGRQRLLWSTLIEPLLIVPQWWTCFCAKVSLFFLLVCVCLFLSFPFLGKFYSHAGDPVLGAYWGNYARELDLADRYVNVKCTKLCLRADLPDLVSMITILILRDDNGSFLN